MQPFTIFYFSLNASKTTIFMEGFKGQNENHSMTAGSGSFPKEHRAFFQWLAQI